jgi:hypothetical protein
LIEQRNFLDAQHLYRTLEAPLLVAIGEDDWTAVAAAVAKEGVPGGAGARRMLREEEEIAVGAEDVDGLVKDLAVAA